MKRVMLVLACAVAIAFGAMPALAYTEAPILAKKVAAGALPSLDQRLPASPRQLTYDDGKEIGRYGGTMNMLMGRPKDTRMMVVYGYTRLVGYDPEWRLVPDVLESVDVDGERVFTLHLRKGHRWSDGQPFTTEDFRYYWEEVLNNEELSHGFPRYLQVDGKPPVFDIIDETTVRYSWDKPNPFFLPSLAGARPEYIYMPAHYMKQFHAGHTDAETLRSRIEAEGQRDWIALHFRMGHQYQNDNPDLPSLQPWVLKTDPPSTRFVFERNPYFHRVDPEGRQLPYIDEVALSIVNTKLIPAKTAAGESDLQARNLSFENYAVLKSGEERNAYKVLLWRSGRGSQLTLLPNFNAMDPKWRKLLRNRDFRHALSLAVNREEINQVMYFGLANPGNDTVLPESPLFKPEYETAWTEYDIGKANELLDAMGLTERDSDGTRLLSDGEPMDLIIETAGEDPTQVDILQLIAEDWRKIGIRTHIKPEQREVLRNRVFVGSAVMSVWTGLENAIPTPDSSPHELAPTSQHQLHWPKWGQHHETNGLAGEAVDDEAVEELARLNKAWETETDPKVRKEIWHKMLEIRAENTFTIGTVRGVPQPVVVNDNLRNVPAEGIYNWEPGAYFGVYNPDTFWFANAK